LIFVRLLILMSFINVAAIAQNIGDIAFNPHTDDPKFQLCNPLAVWQGYYLKTKMDETAVGVAREIRSKFKSNDAWLNESGIIRVRFVVNCSGVADRFRALGLGFDLQEKQFSESLRSHILAIAKSIQWPMRRANDQTVDYYHYFSLRISNGQLTDIIQ
jgi:hypothetical protein